MEQQRQTKNLILQENDVLEKGTVPKLEVDEEARPGLEVEKDLKQRLEENFEVENDGSPRLEAGSDSKVCKSLQRIEDVESDKSVAEERHQKVNMSSSVRGIMGGWVEGCLRGSFLA